ncbi:zinc finger SWIM domain-containing protein 7 [Echeneis naucrates]|uniref:SWIM-type domain-containing protein n=1 Tax=Echeneis naucrates TaxID=173247 RepID=A0A665TM88_ECHNA|nr:zinc finger SWIM domain-containing protein 7 [Echeneis naucrates]XP_029375941.1 zinc finger SWIM domain-containing protein 7 [Echeneis naucrates]
MTSGANMRSLLPAVAEQLFRDIQRTYKETCQIPDDLLLALKFVFGPCALQALDLVDQCSVSCLSSPSGRKAFQVMGGSGRLYTCFVSCHYCPCPAFTYTVLRRNEGLLCKHILAAYLCQAMGVTQQESVSDQQMSVLLSGTASS